MKKETAKKTIVIAKTQTFFKIITPIILIVLVGFWIWYLIILEVSYSLYIGIPIIILLIAMIVLSLLNPIKAIVYDEEKQEFTIRAAQTFITNFKRRYVKLSEIERVVGYPMNIWIPSFKDGLFIYINNNKKPMSIRTINHPELAAEKINLIIMQAAIKKEIDKKNTLEESKSINN